MRAHSDLRSGFSNVDSSDTGLAIRWGGGVDSYLTEHWLINIEVSDVNPTGDVKDIDYFSLGGGIQYRF